MASMSSLGGGPQFSEDLTNSMNRMFVSPFELSSRARFGRCPPHDDERRLPKSTPICSWKALSPFRGHGRSPRWGQSPPVQKTDESRSLPLCLHRPDWERACPIQSLLLATSPG